VQVHEAVWHEPEIRSLIEDHFVEVVLEGLVRDAATAATRVITPSESARRQVIDHFELQPDRVHAVMHGVDAQVFRPARDGGAALIARSGGLAEAPYVLFASQIHPRKNLSVLRAAMAELAAEGLPHQLVIVGGEAQDRVDSQDLIAQAAADLPGTQGRVVYFQSVSEPDLAALMAGASAFCLPSLMEGFGLTALEAMSCGAPVVVSDRGSLPEVVGDAGVVVAPTVGAVRDALASVLTDAERAAALGAAARQRALQLTWAATGAGWFAVVRRALEEV
jgi:glycosyltransferase involved in cell wall biosynthesis